MDLCRPDLDFGRGFYTTTLERQARHWAFRRFEPRSAKEPDNFPVVLKFKPEREQIAGLQSLQFVLAGYDHEDYWSLVQHCRQSRASRGGRPEIVNDHFGPVRDNGRWFDLVAGPVVADWKQRAVLNEMDQFSFHTAQAIDTLNRLVQSGDPERYTWNTVTS